MSKREDKTLLRLDFKQHLQKLSLVEKSLKSRAATEHLHLLLSSLKLKSNLIGIFSPMPDEVDWTMDQLIEKKFQLSFPRPSKDISGGMDFVVARLNELKPNHDFGTLILVPSFGENCSPEVLVVPGLGFSKKGERLGRGKGYYDQYIQKKRTIKIGLCFDLQVVDSLPTEIHDQKMNYLVTESGVQKFN